MSSKILVATAIMAAGSFMFIDTADAQRRGGGAERGGNANAEAGGRRGGARQNRRNRQAGQAQGQRRNAGARNGTRRNANRARNQQRNGERNRNARRNEQNAQARAPRTKRAPKQARTPRASRTPKHVERRPQRPAPGILKRWSRDFGGLRPRWTQRFALRNTWRRLPWVGRGGGRRSCTAVARTNGGDGRTLRNTYGDGYGRRACRKAMNVCNLKLDRRQARGRNPYARCVIAYR